MGPIITIMTVQDITIPIIEGGFTTIIGDVTIMTGITEGTITTTKRIESVNCWTEFKEILEMEYPRSLL